MNPWTAACVALVLWIGGTAAAIAASSDHSPVFGGVVLGVCAAGGGCYLGTAIRLRRRR